MPKKLLSELSAHMRFLSPAERRIAQVILCDPKTFTTYSMVELSSLASVSHGSINNFSKKFAGGGFPVLKLKVAEGLSDFGELPFSAAEKSDAVSDVLLKNKNDILAALNNTVDICDESALKRAADMIFSAKKVELFGVFRSAVVASNFHFGLLQLGIPASFVTDVLSSAISASMLEPDCLAVAISSSGKTKEVIDAVRKAKEKGVPVISITSNKSSPLAVLSDISLIAAGSGRTISGAATEVQLSQMLLTDTLCSYLRAKIDSDGEKRYWELREILNSHNVED